MIENVCSNKRKENNKTRNMKIFDQVKYQEDLKELENETLTFSNVNETFNKFQTELIKIIHKHGSYITLSKRESKQRHEPLITKSILYSIKTFSTNEMEKLLGFNSKI